MNGEKAIVNHDVTAIASVVASGNGPFSEATEVVATTTTITGSGAGLIVSFTTTAAGAINATGRLVTTPSLKVVSPMLLEYR